MLTELTIVSAFLAGLLSAAHCIGMCGGIVGALTLTIPNNQSLWLYLFSYNLGRISSYTIAGLVVGFLGASVTEQLSLHDYHFVILQFSGIFMIILGLYMGDWWKGLAILEQMGHHLWCKLEPWGQNLIPVKKPWQAFGFGLVWGWLPCGLVYSILAFSLASCNTWQGGTLMLAFGLGTLPTSLALGATTKWIINFTNNSQVRKLTAILIVILGLIVVYEARYTSYG
ncbi:sulfite exporter TauE/SafE family protein [Candidatus Halobeggiatoa sp. HSG11]|nr:sulfite exporter TauE/SafE family protein [Candidatus Halobeggiatoa sp. HSG11]